MHKAWSGIEEVPYCLLRSSVKFQGHAGQKKIADFDPNCIYGLWLQFEMTDGFEIMDVIH